MAKTNQIALCTQCRAELPLPLPKECPSCSHVIVPPENPYFGSPDYLAHQLDKYELELNPRYLDPEAKYPTETDTRKLEDVRIQHVKWARDCPLEDKLAALMDARLILSQIVHSSTKTENLRQITTLGKSIGKIAESIEQFFRCGGAHHDADTRPVLGSPYDPIDGYRGEKEPG